jgi:hypothetical protein
MSMTAEPITAETKLPFVEAELTYLGEMSEKPFNYTYGPPPGKPLTNHVYDPHRVHIHNLRALASAASLDREGFALLDHPTACNDLYDDDELHRVYYPECEAAVAEATGASRVIVFDHTLRRRAPIADRTPGVPRQPVARVHNDYTETSGPQRVRDLMGAEAEALLRGRYAFINLWRPISGPVVDMPLAYCDARSVAYADFVGSDLIYADRRGETYAVRYRPTHRWFYAPLMRRDEAVLLKCFDSARSGVARFAPHSAFVDPNTPKDAPPRESIEIRTIAFW